MLGREYRYLANKLRRRASLLSPVAECLVDPKAGIC